jgi:NAD(P)-dependent dehydrogenase (short-subunit alcohol dehydrogenase family)
MDVTHNKIAVIGGSRGLGAALVGLLKARADAPVVRTVSRRSPADAENWWQADLSRSQDQDRILIELSAFAPTLVICTVGGGPYGEYGRKNWSDHEWALQVSLIFPAKLWHWALRQPGAHQVVVVGSSVAEDAADPRAASYALSKHGLHGLHRTLVAEARPAAPQPAATPPVDLRLYSPGYMDTDLLPKNALARQGLLWSPREVAQDLLQWLEDGPRFDHRRLAVTPSSQVR